MSAPTCFACDARPAMFGALCGPCLPPAPDEAQLQDGALHSAASPGAGAWLADAWGRLRPIGEVTVIGRTSLDFAVLSPGVSRNHAEIWRDAAGWSIRDLDSHNGTFVGALRISEPTRLASRDRILLGPVAFVFLLGQPTPRHLEASGGSTCSVVYQPFRGQGAEPRYVRMVEPLRGGGGMIEAADKQFQLSLLQFDLVRKLLARRESDDADETVRGFVPSAELMSTLPWDSPSPSPEHLKQLVRRLRRQLEGSGLGIEASRGFGYRVVLEGDVVCVDDAE